MLVPEIYMCFCLSCYAIGLIMFHYTNVLTLYYGKNIAVLYCDVM